MYDILYGGLFSREKIIFANCHLNKFCRKNFHAMTTIIGFELPPQSYLWVIVEATPTDFHEENFCGRTKSTKFVKIFSLENNPLYGSQMNMN